MPIWNRNNLKFNFRFVLHEHILINFQIRSIKCTKAYDQVISGTYESGINLVCKSRFGADRAVGKKLKKFNIYNRASQKNTNVSFEGALFPILTGIGLWPTKKWWDLKLIERWPDKNGELLIFFAFLGGFGGHQTPPELFLKFLS